MAPQSIDPETGKTHQSCILIRLGPNEGLRADLAILNAIRERGQTVSRARLKTWFQKDQIRLNEIPISASRILLPGDYSIEITEMSELLAQAEEALPSPQGCFLPVVYEDSQLLVLNKASGVASVPHSALETGTAVNAALAHFPGLALITAAATASRSPLEPGLLHRLDTGTSGLLVFAKTPEEFERLLELWRKRQVRKIYRCLVVQTTACEVRFPHTISFPLGHDVKSTKRMKMLRSAEHSGIRGKALPATTHLRKICGQFPYRSREAELSLLDLEVEIETGVMHQIRCHLSGVGLPILGDPLYGKSVPELSVPLTLPNRLWLHASRLEIPLTDGMALSLVAELPEFWPRAR